MGATLQKRVFSCTSGQLHVFSMSSDWLICLPHQLWLANGFCSIHSNENLLTRVFPFLIKTFTKHKPKDILLPAATIQHTLTFTKFLIEHPKRRWVGSLSVRQSLSEFWKETSSIPSNCKWNVRQTLNQVLFSTTMITMSLQITFTNVCPSICPYCQLRAYQPPHMFFFNFRLIFGFEGSVFQQCGVSVAWQYTSSAGNLIPFFSDALYFAIAFIFPRHGDGAMVRSFASHQCGLGWTQCHNYAGSLLVLYSASRRYPLELRFPPVLQNSPTIWYDFISAQFTHLVLIINLKDARHFERGWSKFSYHATSRSVGNCSISRMDVLAFLVTRHMSFNNIFASRFTPVRLQKGEVPRSWNTILTCNRLRSVMLFDLIWFYNFIAIILLITSISR